MKDPQLQQHLTRADGLAVRLKDARAHMLAKDLASQAGWLASKVSKIEAGRQLPTEQDLISWATLTGTSGTVLDQWRAMLIEAQAVRSTYSRRLRGGQATVQSEYNSIIQAATHIREVATVFVPRYLQTPDYTRAVLGYFRDRFSTVDDVDEATAVRQAGNIVLYDTRRSFQFIIDEAVLRRHNLPPSIRRPQLDRLVSASGLRNVRLGIYPLDRPSDMFLQNSFVLIDDTGFVETFTGNAPKLLADEVDRYDAILAELWVSALEGQDARRLMQDIADALPDES